MRRSDWLIGAFLVLSGCTTVNTGGAICQGTWVNGVCVAETPVDAARDGAPGDTADAAQPIEVSSYTGLPCTSNFQCGDLICIDGYCGAECFYDKDCPGSLGCFKLQCVGEVPDVAQDAGSTDAGAPDVPGVNDMVALPDVPALVDAGPKKCKGHIECAPDKACIGGVCAKECDVPADCGEEAGWDCFNFQCFFEDPNPPDVVTPKDTGNPGPDDGPPPVDTGPTKFGYGVPCASKEECESGLCVGNPATGDGTCTQLCGGPGECPGTDACIAVGQGTSICYASDSGKPCPAGGACVSSYSLTTPKGQCICSVECATADDCQPSAACSVWEVPGGGVKHLCTPIGLPCKVSQTNPKGDACAQLCYPITNTAGVCSAQCVTALDCPQGWKCFTESLPGGDIIKTCQP